MFNIGDKIDYPVQGVGIVDFIAEKELFGETKQFYNIHLINNTMKVLLPTSRAESFNIRLISNNETLDELLLNLNTIKENVAKLDNLNCKQRIQLNTNKIKSGLLSDLIEVIFNLSNVKKSHALNSCETQQLKNAKKLLADEVCLIKNISSSEANSFLTDKLSTYLN